MKRWFATPAELRRAGVLGLNGRNGSFVMRLNKRSRYPFVDDKVRCKKLLEQRGMPVPGLIGQISFSGQSGRFDRLLGGRDKFAIKPANGSGGDGILVITGQRGGRYISSSGRMWDRGEIAHHLTNVISGLYSLSGQPDTAMIEELVEFDPIFERIAFQGVPDIRVIVYRGVPIMSMVRLPTRASDGKANLHQGAIGAGIAIATGKTIAAVLGNHHIEEHVDTGMPLLGFEVPEWERILLMAANCYEAVQLGYLGVDIVLDRNLGPLILELNARPGLNIQIANHGGLRSRLDTVDACEIADAPAEQRARWAKDAFGA